MGLRKFEQGINLKNETKYFCKRHTWNTEDGYISLYCKDKGNAGTENKYELPRPLDEKLYFGKIVIVRHRALAIIFFIRNVYYY